MTIYKFLAGKFKFQNTFIIKIFHLKLTSHHCFIHVWTKTQDFSQQKVSLNKQVQGSVVVFKMLNGSVPNIGTFGRNNGFTKKIFHFLCLAVNKWCCVMVVSKDNLFQSLDFSIIWLGRQKGFTTMYHL